MKRGRRAWTVAGLLALPAVAVIGVAMSPPFVAFGAAVASAALWCRWLEQHPEPPDGTRAIARA
jgi:hypothetical protein